MKFNHRYTEREFVLFLLSRYLSTCCFDEIKLGKLCCSVKCLIEETPGTLAVYLARESGSRVNERRHEILSSSSPAQHPRTRSIYRIYTPRYAQYIFHLSSGRSRSLPLPTARYPRWVRQSSLITVVPLLFRPAPLSPFPRPHPSPCAPTCAHRPNMQQRWRILTPASPRRATNPLSYLSSYPIKYSLACYACKFRRTKPPTLCNCAATMPEAIFHPPANSTVTAGKIIHLNGAGTVNSYLIRIDICSSPVNVNLNWMHLHQYGTGRRYFFPFFLDSPLFVMSMYMSDKIFTWQLENSELTVRESQKCWLSWTT